MMADNAKSLILNAVVGQGHSTSYGALLHKASLLGLEPNALEPESDEELAEWRGYFEGLRAALGCLVMHERRIEPELAPGVVDDQLTFATGVLERLRATGAGD